MLEANLPRAHERAVLFAHDQLPQCCAELLAWRTTGVLPEGKVRELAELCSFAGHHALGLAQSLVQDAALEQLAPRAPVGLAPRDTEAPTGEMGQALRRWQDSIRSAFKALTRREVSLVQSAWRAAWTTAMAARQRDEDQASLPAPGTLAAEVLAGTWGRGIRWHQHWEQCAVGTRFYAVPPQENHHA